MLLHQLEDAAWMFQSGIHFGKAGSIQLVTPARFVVGLFVFVPTGKETFFERESFFDQEGRVRMQTDVLALVCVVSESVMDQAAEERNVRSGTNRDVQIRNRSRAIETWVDGDD